MKFKVGDNVKIIANESDSINEVGDIGVVVEVDYLDCQVKVDGKGNFSNWQLKSELELVTPITPNN